MKKILIIAAQKEELSIYLKETSFDYSKGNIYKQEFNGKEIYCSVCGIGKVSTGLYLGKILSIIKPELIINIGMCGSLKSSNKIHDIFIATSSCYYDVDLIAFNHPFGEMSDQPLYFDTYADGIKILKTYNIPNARFGLIISADKFATKNNFNSNLLSEFKDPSAIDMESAAVGQVCHELKIPYMIIRNISDNALTEKNEKVYNVNLVTNFNQTKEILEKLISDL